MEKKKPSKNKRLSLHPIEFEDALKSILKVPPEKKTSKTKDKK